MNLNDRVRVLPTWRWGAVGRKGTITNIRLAKAFVEFEIGGSDWIDLDHLERVP